MIDHATRMYVEANRRIGDADILSQSLHTQSDSAALLYSLGFEVLLKCAILLSGEKPRQNHRYADLWINLPVPVRDEILASARLRMPGYTDFNDLTKLLKAYQHVFEKGRYYYEFYENYTLKEQSELGQRWEELGAPLDQATVQYFPHELTCLIYGLNLYIEGRLGEGQT
ncbi:MAG: hypothetical protein ABI343_13040 [Burkholderiaceae bacterium]